MPVTTHAAVDLGASSGRVMLGRIGPETLDLKEAARFPNAAVPLADGLHWDVVGLYQHALNGLAEAVRQTRDIGGLVSVGIDSWAVDYGLLTGTDAQRMSLLGVPFHYRDVRTSGGVERTHRHVPFAELYRRNGLQFLPFNTLYQLAADDLLPMAEKLLLIPDLLGYWLTGEQLTEQTNASTTGLLEVHTKSWDTELMRTLGMPPGLFAPVAAPGTALGTTRGELTDVLGAEALPVTLVGSHDTASAVVGTPLSTSNAAYISCGTWGLVGLELKAPVVTDASREANFTNEGGVDGRTRFLTNVMGTWLLSETLASWRRRTGKEQHLAELLTAAAEVPAERVVVFDVQDPRFVPPGDMAQRIADLCREQQKPVPQSCAEIVRSIVESLAAGFAKALAEAVRLAGRSVDTVHMVGGGSLNALLCQATADRSGYPVIAGPVEATAIGNLLIQARTAGTITGTLEEIRGLIARTHHLTTYQPRG
ncbi:rhamnulokinase [Nesterenkonia ebinurensis]|uniref:rhamnulokinase n=1 Tax=Nesterenkonia ebinurensis TaxID=2608252 RepID=UPI00123DC3C0|nr:rhamnulokinase family protein [Nesterenkonia ebinurensis]